ncbi:hypothetical protein O181_076323 [Austropuccinia psidii MF-1]|uniref:Reverse transcriptase Ty1/copia-type domain-containing protein n=1 Tax=Austropuccinia psidii MF-1 TaxID=1389203 RepID=A0A9Q3FEQ8_9BASI|nr:hypothetical protein [Austropuccinia psidii MF-1]
MKDEITSMMEEEVFEVTDLSTALRTQKVSDVLSSKWVFAKKTAPIRYKAHLVARGFRQTRGINFEETFAPTPTFGALRLLLSMAISNDWAIKTFDVKVAFLHSLIDMPVFIWPPQGMMIDRGKVLKLKKALYGTKQAARCWWKHLTNILQNIGFQPNKEDLSTYTFHFDMGSAILWIHVDDGAIACSSKDLLLMICHCLNEKLKIKWDNKISGLVGLEIAQHPKGILISQPDLIRKLVNLSPSNITAKSPLPHNCNLVSNKAAHMDIPYLKRIGMLLYIAQGSRPDITYAVNYLARFSLGTDPSHWEALEHLIAYLRYTLNIGIYIGNEHPENKIECYVDANWGGEGNRSSHGFILFHNKNPIAWQSKRQATVASSTCQAEYMALSFASKECLWMTNLFHPILAIPTPIIYSDNKTSIDIALDIANRKQTRHLIREFNLINEYICTKKVILSWVSTDNQMADILTKALGSIKVKEFLSKLIGDTCLDKCYGGECYDSPKNQKKTLEHSKT